MSRGRNRALKVHTPRRVTAAELPSCPLPLNVAGLAEWNRFGPILLADGRLDALTAPAFALYCDAWSRYVAASAELEAKGMLIETRRGLSVSKKLNPVMAILRESLKTLMLLGSHFGLTPYARRKLGPVEATDLDALESLDAEFS